MARVQLWVIDSSVMAKWVLAENEDWRDRAKLLLERLERGEVMLTAPVLAKYEVANAIRHKSMSDLEKIDCLEQFYGVPVKYYSISEKQAVTALMLASDLGITFYDAVFIELAKRLETDLITANPKHQKKFGGVKVMSLKEYN